MFFKSKNKTSSSNNFSCDNISAGGSIVINGKSYKGNSINITNGVVYVDGVKQDNSTNEFVFNIQVTGDVGKIDVDVADSLIVHGDVVNVDVTNGNVSVGSNVLNDVNSSNGDVTVAGDIHGDCETTNGSIKAKTIGGHCSTVNGNITK